MYSFAKDKPLGYKKDWKQRNKTKKRPKIIMIPFYLEYDNNKPVKFNEKTKTFAP